MTFDHDDDILEFEAEHVGNVIMFACGTTIKKRKRQKVI